MQIPTVQPLDSTAPVIVYIDFKSPYAYLAIEPTRQLERDLGMQFDWRPFVLDIPSYLGSARLGKRGEVVAQNRSEEQWSGVKYAYYDCRRYAQLQGLKIRGTEKIWDTHLVATAMLWCRARGRECVDRLIDAVYAPFWIRELDVESDTVLGELLDDIDADGEAFLAWARSEGSAQNRQLQEAAFAAGVYGVPTYVVEDERYFGREHLPRIQWQLSGKFGPAPDISYTLPTGIDLDDAAPETLCIGVDHSMDSLLAIPKLLALCNDYRGSVTWCRINPRKPSTPPADNDTSRGAMHKRYRVANTEACARRYGPDRASGDIYQAVEDLLRANHITLEVNGPDQIMQPPMPGVAVIAGEELFIGRHHLPLLTARLLGTPKTGDM